MSFHFLFLFIVFSLLSTISFFYLLNYFSSFISNPSLTVSLPSLLFTLLPILLSTIPYVLYTHLNVFSNSHAKQKKIQRQRRTRQPAAAFAVAAAAAAGGKLAWKIADCRSQPEGREVRGTAT